MDRVRSTKSVEPRISASNFQTVGTCAGGIQAADDGACRRTGNDFDGDAVLFEGFDDADMGKPFGCAAAEC